MSKGKGEKIAIKFNLPLVGDVTANANAFTITAMQYLYTDGPNNNVGLTSKTFPVQSVNIHPTETNAIQLIMLEEIRNAQGLINVQYNQALGNLAGAGGAVLSFTKTFLPEDLEEGLTYSGGKYGTQEFIQSSISGSIEMKHITKLNSYSPTEYINSSVSGSIELKHISIINP